MTFQVINSSVHKPTNQEGLKGIEETGVNERECPQFDARERPTRLTMATREKNDDVDADVDESMTMRARLGATASTLLSQGAEARVFATTFLNRDCVCKQRFRKKYRLRALDEKLTRSRVNGEARALVKAAKCGVLAPRVLWVDAEEACVYMERVPGVALKEALRSDACEEADLREYGRQIGQAVSALHDGGIVHGDLTTSNFIVRASDGKIVTIDFGLSYPSDVAEDKGVDLYVLERAITAAHPSQTLLFDEILATYKKKSRMWCATLNKFAEVRARGRKRSMVG